MTQNRDLQAASHASSFKQSNDAASLQLAAMQGLPQRQDRARALGEPLEGQLPSHRPSPAGVVASGRCASDCSHRRACVPCNEMLSVLQG